MKDFPSNHHVLPLSRGGNNRWIVVIDRITHKAWHKLFENLTNEEALVMISMIMIRSCVGKEINVHVARKAARNKRFHLNNLSFTIKLYDLPLYFVTAWEEFFGEDVKTVEDCKKIIECVMVPGKRFTREGFIAERKKALKPKKRQRERTAA